MLSLLLFTGILYACSSEPKEKQGIYGKFISTKHQNVKAPEYVTIGQRIGKKYYAYDSVAFENNEYHFDELDIPLPGRYELHVSRKKFLLNYLKKEDLPVQMDFIFDERDSLKPFITGKEVQQMIEVENLYQTYLRNISPIVGEALPMTRDPDRRKNLTSEDTARVEELKSLFHDQMDYYADHLKAFAERNPRGYATEVLLPVVYINGYAWEGHEERKIGNFIPEKFIEFIPFHDERIVNEPHMDDKLFLYISTDAYETGEFVHRINHIMERASANRKVYDYVVEYYIQSFIDHDYPEMREYVEVHFKGKYGRVLPDANS